MPQLIAPTKRLRTAWVSAHAEWGVGVHEDGFGIEPTDHVDTVEGYERWVDRLLADTRTTYRWVVEDGAILGAIALRHNWDDHTATVGHIGFGIRPTARRRGLATWALASVLDVARLSGLDRVLLVCAEGNTVSARTIERAGGVLADVHDTAVGPACHYWIDLAVPHPREL